MYRSRMVFVVALAVAITSVHADSAEIDSPPSVAEKKPFDTHRRARWTTSRVRGTPEPPDPYTARVAFPMLQFYEPLAIASVPGANRFVVAERPGKIYYFDNDSATREKTLLLDVAQTVYGVALHPRFAENGLFFVTAETPGGEGQPAEMQVLRFRANTPSQPRGEPATRQVILGWPADGHRGGCLRFGPDGYLYIAVGDGSGIADELETGQYLGDLLGSILRIDVDHASPGRPYTVPDDNPFVNVAGARPEIYSYGHRQVWKFSFDFPTGNLWAGEVGQDLWEMIYLVQKGGNYGWSVNEGKHPFRPERKLGPSAPLPPVVEHSHNDFRSITGGYVYHGSRLPELDGAYIYADYDTGRIWSLRYAGGQVTDHRQLTDTQIRVVAFGQDSQGELFLVDFAGGRIYELAPAPRTEPTAPFPRLLSETGLFTSTKDLVPAGGLIPYSVNAELWSDGARKSRYLALPGDSRIEYNAVTYPQPAPGAEPGWRFPDGAVLVKTFSLQMEIGDPSSSRRLETRILHHQRMPGDDDEYGNQVWHGYTYLWNDAQTDAELLGPERLDREYSIVDPAAPGGRREQKWHFPSRAECTLCHTMAAKYVLGVNTLQMNRDHDYGDETANQLAVLDRLGVFTQRLASPPAQLPRLVDYRDATEDLTVRARSYLHANCSHCHRKWGGGNAEFQLLASLPLGETGTIDVPPGQGSFGLADPRILAPGNPKGSLIHYRMTKVGLGRMPHVASNLIDQQGAELLAEWIRQLGEQDAHRTGLKPAAQ